MEKMYLVLSSMGVAVIGLVYGLFPPCTFLKHLEGGGELAKSVDIHNMLRAIMGLYLGIAAFLFACARRESWVKTGVILEVIVMGGLGVGRIFSLLIDGIPSTILVVYMLLEISLAVWGLWILRRMSN